MIIQMLNRGDPEKIFIVVKNASSGTDLVDGDCVVWFLNASSTDGIAGALVLQSPAALRGRAGIAAQSILAGAYGLIQIYGIHNNVKTTVAALAGDTDIVSDANGAVKAIAAESASFSLGVCLTTGANNRAKCFIQCM